MTDIYSDGSIFDNYGDDIHPNRFNRVMNGLKAKRQHVRLTHNPSSVEPGQKLLVRFPNLGIDDVIVPGSFYISGKLKVTSAKDKARYIVNNVSRKLIKTLKIRFEGNEVLSIDNYDVLKGYFDLFLSKHEKAKRVYQGIQPANGLKLRVESNGATGTANETAIKTTLGNRFMIPIDFELLKDIGPYYQAGIGDKLEVELTFNDTSAVIFGSTATLAAASDSDYNYQFSDIKTEWDQITDKNLANAMHSRYQMLALPFKRYLYHQTKVINKTDSVINLSLNIPSKSLTHIFILAIDPDDRKKYAHNETFKNLDIKKATVTIEGSPNQLFSSGMLKEDTWVEIDKLFPNEHEVTLGEFLTSKYAFCLDLRPSIDHRLHGSGIRLENTAEGMTLQIERTPATSGDGKLNLMIFLIQDAQLNIQDGRFHSIEY